MTLPPSGPLSLADIQGEFGGSHPTSLNEYYAGGAYVPSGTTGTYGPVPTSGTISIRNFYGTSNIIESHTLTIGNNGGGTAYGYVGAAFGTLAPSTSSVVFGGSLIAQLVAVLSGSWSIYLIVNGFHANSGFNNLLLNSNALARASATYSYDGIGNATTWQWAVGSNIIGTSGTVPANFN